MHDKTTADSVRITAPARLHLGFIDLNGDLGRRYGSIGLSIDQPATELVVSRAAANSAIGAESERALKAVQRFSEALELPGRYAVKVDRAIPAHAGLGSGTQLALAIGAGLAKLEKTPRPYGELAGILERGARSAIGLASFEGGGFIVDGGRGTRDDPPPVLIRTAFPQSWRGLLVMDTMAKGVHGDRETTAFAKLDPMPTAVAAHLSRLVLMRLVPGVIESDLDAFGTALTEIQQIVGNHFANAQGGSPWTSPATGRLAAKLAKAGATGVGQSSWGPTGFAFVASETAAQRLFHSFVQEAKGEGLELLIVRGRNNGARLELAANAETVTSGRK